ncbi:U3 small nucleolar RNA-interacting protein 2 [Anabrus simplex]|uniref:U3 small nucleolar RNA-interacting protein 2 n=1 Tax=Anabrus simplex TaxID=316456 RepID=UPI0035A3D166
MSFFIRTDRSVKRNEQILKQSHKRKRKHGTSSEKDLGKVGDDDEEIESEDDEFERPRKSNDFQDDESDDPGETVQEKRLRLAKVYLEEIQRREAALLENGEVNKDTVTNLLKDDLLEKSHRLRKVVADKYTGFHEEGIKVLRCKDHHLTLTCLVISSDNKFIYTGSKDSAIVKWSIDEARKVKSIRGNKKDKTLIGAVLCLAISSDNKFLVSGGTNKVVQVWNPNTLELVHSFSGHKDSVTGVAFRKNTHTLFSCSLDRTVKLWNLVEMSYVETLFGHQTGITAVDALMGERALTSGGRDNSVRLWKIIEESQLIYNGHKGSIDCVKLINEDHFISGGDDGFLCVWGTMKKKPLCSVPNAHGVCSTNEEPNWISSVAALLNTDLVASSSNDGSVKLWKCERNYIKLVHLFSIPVVGFVNSMAFTSDGTQLILAVGKEHRLGRWSKIDAAKNTVVIIPLVKSGD